MTGSWFTDYDWIIWGTIYILITSTGDSREPNLQAKANKPLLLVRDWVQTGLEFKHQPRIGFQWAEEAPGGREGGMGGGPGDRGVCDGLGLRWRGMRLQTCLGKRINPRLCHPVGLMCCISVKQLGGSHLFPSQSILPSSKSQFKGPHGADWGRSDSERKHLRGRRSSFPKDDLHIHLSSKDDRYGDVIMFCCSCCTFYFSLD